MAHFRAAKQVQGLLGWIVLAFAVATTGAMASASAGSFYGELVQPDWAPPAWLFGPVWTVLYFLMAIASWMVWKEGGFRESRVELTLYLVQLAANGLWTWLFFAWRLGMLAFVEILILWILILATIVAFWRVNKVAAVLLMPYLAWVSFASALAFTLWQKNPGLL